MALDTDLAARIRKRLGKRKGLTEKKMFGGLAFLLNGNMCCGIHGSDMIVRLDPKDTDLALKEQHTKVFDLTGRPMKGWILVEAKGLATDEAVARWVGTSLKYTASLAVK